MENFGQPVGNAFLEVAKNSHGCASFLMEVRGIESDMRMSKNQLNRAQFRPTLARPPFPTFIRLHHRSATFVSSWATRGQRLGRGDDRTATLRLYGGQPGLRRFQSSCGIITFETSLSALTTTNTPTTALTGELAGVAI